MIPDRVLSANVDAACAAAEMGGDEVMVSWLPLYHDMGLVGFLAIPMTRGVELVQAAPQDFLAHPGNWMQWISDWRGTATAGPNFAWVLATRALKRMHDLDLSSLTLALSGAEPVDPDAVEAFVAAAGRFGFSAGRHVPGLRHGRGGDRRVVPATPPWAGLRHRRSGRPGTGPRRQAGRRRRPDDLALIARRLPLLGPPVPGLEMRVVDPETYEDRPERHVGELLIRGTSVTPGYYKRPDETRDAVPRRVAAHRGPRLPARRRAGPVRADQGRDHRRRPQRVPRGHRAGRRRAARHPGRQRHRLRDGGLQGQGERGRRGRGAGRRRRRARRRAPRHPPPHARGVRAAATRRDAGAAGTLPKTSSGKLQRSKCREQYLEEQLELL